MMPPRIVLKRVQEGFGSAAAAEAASSRSRLARREKRKPVKPPHFKGSAGGASAALDFLYILGAV